MKNMKRALRRHQKDVKFIKRLKVVAYEHGNWLITSGKTNKKEWIKNPTWEELKSIDCGYIYKLKTMSTTCSCSMCAYPKYDRTKQKKENRMLLKWQLEN